MAKSIITDNMERCFVCPKKADDPHHVFFGTANRKLSDKYGLIVPLCRFHHTGSMGVHRNRQLDLKLKERGQVVFEEKVGSREDFVRLFGRNYL